MKKVNFTLIFLFLFNISFAQKIETSQYDALHRFEKIIKSDGSTITYQYDEVGNRIGMVITSNLPAQAGIISGLSTVSKGQNNVQYSVGTITNASGYMWSVPIGASIVSGNNTNVITVNYATSAVSGNMNVYGTNSFGNGGTSPNLAVTVTISSGLNNEENKMVRVYPNPVSESFYISGFEDNATLKITDISGKVMLEKQITENDIVSISSFPKGLYIVKLITKKGVIEKKLLKE